MSEQHFSDPREVEKESPNGIGGVCKLQSYRLSNSEGICPLKESSTGGILLLVASKKIRLR